MQHRKQPDSDGSLESLEARLRALPAPPMPSDLEAKLLLAIPPAMPRGAVTSRIRRRAVWAGAAVGLVAACLLTAFIWRERGDRITGPTPEIIPEKKEAPELVAARVPGDFLRTTPWVEVRRGLDVAETPTFTWPIEEKSPLVVSVSIRPDLFD
jgi:hypothetical protein